MIMKYYHDYDNRRGKNYGAGMSAGCSAHTRGWRAGVRVTIGEQDEDPERVEVAVWMTGGSGGHWPSTYLGTVRETADGPLWVPSATAKPSRSARVRAARRELADVREQITTARRELDMVPDDARRELADVMERIRQRSHQLALMPAPSKDENNPGIARHALELARDTLLGFDCPTGDLCGGPGSDRPCRVCAAIAMLRAELARLDGPRIVTTPEPSDDMGPGL
jgi:hypothetical protein